MLCTLSKLDLSWTRYFAGLDRDPDKEIEKVMYHVVLLGQNRCTIPDQTGVGLNRLDCT